jgi:hypothetical protein
MTMPQEPARAPLPSHRHAALVPEKKTLKRLEELRSLPVPSTALFGRAVEILRLDRGLAANLEEDVLQLLAKSLVEERGRKRAAAELIGEAVRAQVKVQPPGAGLPALKSAAKTLNDVLRKTSTTPARVVDELRVEKRDGGAQLVALATSLEDEAPSAVVASLRALLVQHGFGPLDVRLDVSGSRNARVAEAREILDGVLQTAAVPVRHPRTPEDVLRRCREFKTEHKGGREVVVGRVFSTEGVTQQRILAAMRDVLRRRGYEDVAVRLELLQ